MAKCARGAPEFGVLGSLTIAGAIVQTWISFVKWWRESPCVESLRAVWGVSVRAFVCYTCVTLEEVKLRGSWRMHEERGAEWIVADRSGIARSCVFILVEQNKLPILGLSRESG